MTTYGVPVAVLIAAIVFFFALARGRYARFGIAQLLLRIVVALPLLASAVMLHFLRTNEGTSMLPPVFPAPGFLIIATGVLEILGAVGLFIPRARRRAALWIAIMLVLIFPVNIYVAGQTFDGMQMPSVPVRLAMQVVYIWMVLFAGYGLPGGKATKSTKPLRAQ